MVEDSSSQGSLKERRAFTDVTNRHGKRGFLYISNNSVAQSGSGDKENVASREKNYEISKKVCQGKENSITTRAILEVIEDSRNNSQLSKAKGVCSKEKLGFVGEIPQSNRGNSISKIPNEVLRQEIFKRGGGQSKHSSSSDGISKLVGDGECSGNEKSSSSATISVNEKCQDDKVVYPDVAKEYIDLDSSDDELTIEDVGGIDGEDVTSKKLSLSSTMEPSAASSSKFSELDRCTGFNSDGGIDSSPGQDILKACSCSFCLKAAHIWSDLNYQDAKGRIAALSKSRKEVRSLVEKSTIPPDVAKLCQGNANNSVKLEVDLMSRWRSLFVHTEEILVCETTELQSNLFALRELRENCKTDLETITGDLSNRK